MNIGRFITIALLFITIAGEGANAICQDVPRANFIFEINVESLKQQLDQCGLRLENAIAFGAANDSDSQLDLLSSLTRIQAGLGLKNLREPPELLMQMTFKEPASRNTLLEIIQDADPSIRDERFLPLKRSEGLPSLFAELKSPQSVNIGTSPILRGEKQSFLELAKHPMWTQMPACVARVGIGVHTLRSLIVPVVDSMQMDLALKNELSQTIEGCEVLFVELHEPTQRPLRISMVSSSDSTAKKLSKRVEGLLFFARSWTEVYLQETSTGSENTDNAILDVLDSVDVEVDGSNVTLTLDASESTAMVGLWLGQVIRNSIDAKQPVASE